jgi:hypothetical protein
MIRAMESINENKRSLREVGLQTMDLMDKFRTKIDLPSRYGQVEDMAPKLEVTRDAFLDQIASFNLWAVNFDLYHDGLDSLGS